MIRVLALALLLAACDGDNSSPPKVGREQDWSVGGPTAKPITGPARLTITYFGIE